MSGDPTAGDSLQSSKAEAEQFIAALTGSADTSVTFQTFDDQKERKDKSLARWMHGTLSEHWRSLVSLNGRGAGVFIMVNDGDGKGRREENVRALRALFGDDDSGTLTPQALELTPTMLVQSKRGLQPYWRLQDGEPLHAFTAAQDAVARALNTDPAVKDLPRVMRLPGFLHLKDPEQPFLVRVVQTGGRRDFSIEEVLEGVGTALQPPASPLGKVIPIVSHTAVEAQRATAIAKARRYLAGVPPAVQYQQGDDLLYRICAYLKRDCGLTDDQALEVLQDWNRACSPPWPESDLRTKLSNAERYGRNGRGDDAQKQAREIAERYVFVKEQNVYVCKASGAIMKREALNSAHAADVVAGGFCIWTTDDSGGQIKKRFQKASAFIDLHVQQADDLGWWPGKGQIYEQRGRTLINVFRPLKTPPRDSAKPTIWLDHVEWLIPNADERTHLLDVLAYNVQHLDGKVNHALVIGGKTRTGKDLMLKPIAKWSESCWNNVKSEDLGGQFTAYLHGTKFLCVQEARDLSFEHGFNRYNAFKTIIAAPPDDITINQKFLRPYTLPNLVQVIFLTNYENGVYFEDKSDGRYHVIWSSVTPKDADYYARLGAYVEEHYMDVVGWLARRDLSRFHPKAQPPHTTAREEMHTATRGGAELALVEAGEDLSGDQGVFTRKDLVQWAKENDHHGLKNLLDGPPARLGKMFKQAGFDSTKVSVGKRVTIYWKQGNLSVEDAELKYRALVKPRYTFGSNKD